MDEYGQMTSSELLESLKVQSFLKFVQTRSIPEKRLIALFIEKVRRSVYYCVTFYDT